MMKISSWHREKGIISKVNNFFKFLLDIVRPGGDARLSLLAEAL
jgi:hypothetical protein